MLKIALLGILLANLLCQEAIAGSYIYKWRDAQGRLYFTDTPEKVSEQHRGQLSKGLGGKLTDKKAPPRMTRVPVERNHGAVLVPGCVNIHHRVSFFLDTGATYSQITPEDVLALKLDPDYLPPVQVQTADGRSLESQRVKLNSLRIGSFEIRDMEALVGDVRLLGLNVLEQFRMTMDLQRGVLILEPPSP